jgi:hypothetical protein
MIIALIMEPSGTSETLVNFYQTTQLNNPEHIHTEQYYTHSYIYLLLNHKSLALSHVEILPSTCQRNATVAVTNVSEKLRNTLKMEATSCSETSVNKTTWRHIPEDHTQFSVVKFPINLSVRWVPNSRCSWVDIISISNSTRTVTWRASHCTNKVAGMIDVGRQPIHAVYVPSSDTRCKPFHLAIKCELLILICKPNFGCLRFKCYQCFHME